MRVEDVCTDLCADFMCKFCVQILCAYFMCRFRVLSDFDVKGMVN
jgi:hypothetical protein